VCSYGKGITYIGPLRVVRMYVVRQGNVCAYEGIRIRLRNLGCNDNEELARALRERADAT